MLKAAPRINSVLIKSEPMQKWEEIDRILQNGTTQKTEWQDFKPPTKTNQHVLTLRSLRRLMK
jgi:hypothetical protein